MTSPPTAYWLHPRWPVLTMLAALLAAGLLTVSAASPAADTPHRAFLPAVAAPSAPELAALTTLAAGLLMPSEADAPLTPFVWDGAPVEPAAVCAELAARAGVEAEVRDAPALLRAIAASGGPQAPRFRALADGLATHLADPVACRVGHIPVELYLIGRSPGGLVVGLHTTLIET